MYTPVTFEMANKALSLSTRILSRSLSSNRIGLRFLSCWSKRNLLLEKDFQNVAEPKSFSIIPFEPSACQHCNVERGLMPMTIQRRNIHSAASRNQLILGSRFRTFVYRGLKTKATTKTPAQMKTLTAKRPKKKKKGNEKDLKEGFMQVFAYPLTDHEIDFESLVRLFRKQDLYTITENIEDMTDLLHLKAKYNVDDHDYAEKEFFIFREGSLVCWNVPETERFDMLSMIRKQLEEPHPMDLIKEEVEWMDYTLTDKGSDLAGDVIYIQQTEGDVSHLKYAFSNALSQSVKLAVWEFSLEALIESIEPVRKVLKTGTKIPFRRKEILRKHGEIFELRFQMNLNSELLDTPDFYWDREEKLENLYKRLYNHLDIGRRTKVMNEKLNYCDQIISVVDKKATDSSTERLEWMIIALILIEVVFESIYYYERKSSKDQPETEVFENR